MDGINFDLWEKIANFAYHHDDTVWWKLLEGLFCPGIKVGTIHILMVIKVALKKKRKVKKKEMTIRLLILPFF